MASRRTNQGTFWTGALCGAVAACIAGRLLLPERLQFGLIRGKLSGKSKVFRIPLRRDAAAGDPSALAPERSRSFPRVEPNFERSGGAPGSIAAAEVHEVPGHPGQRLDYSDAAQPVRSSRIPRAPSSRQPSRG